MTKKCNNFCEYFPAVIPKVHVIERWLTILVTFYKWNELCLLSLFYSHSTHFYFCRWHKEKISYSNVGQACKNFAAEQDYLYRNKVKKEDSSWLNLFLFVKCYIFYYENDFFAQKTFSAFLSPFVALST